MVAWASAGSSVPEAVRNVRRFQKEIDRVSLSGGGVVTIPAGKWRLAPLELKSGVELRFAPGARFYASTNWSDYASARMPALLFATNATNVRVTGGLFFGEGWAFPRACGNRSPNRPKTAVFCGCRQVTVDGAFFGDSARWTLVFDHCEDVTVRKVKIRAHANYNNDGIDICDTRRVLIADCDIDSDDDAVVFKSRDPHGFCGEAEVRDCLLSANCNMIKCGTESKGAFRDIAVRNCRLMARTPSLVYNRRAGWMTVEGDEAGQGAISLEVVDGGSLENVRVSGIEMDHAAETAIFVRLGRRRREGLGESFLRNVVIENVRGSAASPVACSITGVPADGADPALRPSDIVLRNVSLSVPGGVAAVDVPTEVPEQAAAYPENNMFRNVLPACGFYVRHADRVSFENVSVMPRRPDARPPVVSEDCTDCHLTTNKGDQR